MKSTGTTQKYPPQKNNPKTKYKVVLLGDQNAGKTSIIRRYINNSFDSDYEVTIKKKQATIGIDFLVKNLVKDGKSYRVQLWDTAGQQRFKSLIPSYLKDANCSLIIYDASQPHSLDKAAAWLRLFNQYRNQKALSFLVGNKIDLKQAAKTEKSVELKEELTKLEQFRVSAKQGNGVEEMFMKVIGALDHCAQKVKNQQQQEQEVISAHPLKKQGLILNPSESSSEQRQTSAKQCCKE